MIKFFLIAFFIATIHNVTCWLTFCPKVEPMEGFKWEPVRKIKHLTEQSHFK
jgi:hypothetical protein